MTIEILTFSEISSGKMYELLQLRNEVFIVEQNCVYQDIDSKDQKSLHVLGWKNDRLIGYARCFKPGDYFDEAAIGRVLIKENFRKFGYGKQLVRAAIQAIEGRFKTTKIKISAQTYLTEFYNEFGFKEYGEPYLEDEIPHIAMIRN